MPIATDYKEQDLIAALKQGDQAAFRRIFERHYGALVSGLYRLVREEETCKDLVQEVFVDLWNKRESLDIHTSLGAYLRRASVNRALNYIKQQKRNLLDDTEGLENVADHPESLPEEGAFEDIKSEALFRAIEALPEKCRVVFSLSRFEQLSHKEIADRLGISTKTIENQITKALRLIRAALLKDGGMSPIIILTLIWAGMT